VLSRPLDAARRPQQKSTSQMLRIEARREAQSGSSDQAGLNLQTSMSCSESSQGGKTILTEGMSYSGSSNLNNTEESYIVLYNHMGMDWERPAGFHGVISWLESLQLFGPNSVVAFWARPLDLRLIVQLRTTDAKLHSMTGIHAWDQCLIEYTGQYPLKIKDRRTHLHILRRNLWGRLDQEGFRKFEVDRRRLTKGELAWIECVPKVPYPVPQKSEPPDYYDDPDIQMLGEPSSDVL